MGEVGNLSHRELAAEGYSAVPKPRRGHRRAQGGTVVGGKEPRLAGIELPGLTEAGIEDDDLATWLKEQRPPHYE